MPKPRQKFTNEQMLLALEQGLGIYVRTAAILKCDRDTVARYVDRSPILQKKVKEIIESAVDMAEGSLLKSIQGGNVAATIFFLKTKGKHRGYTEKLEISNPAESQQTLSHEEALKQLK